MYRHMTEPFQELLFINNIRLEPDNTGMKHAQIMRFKIVAVFLLVGLTDILYQLRQPEGNSAVHFHWR